MRIDAKNGNTTARTSMPAPLEFLEQARAQQRARDLVVEEGWRYFVHGCSQVVADVFAIPMPPETVQKLADIAADVRAG